MLPLLQSVSVRWRILAALAVVCAMRVVAAPLTVATYNVENYTLADRMTADGYRTEYPKSEASKQALRAVIRAIDADVLVMQGMGPAPYLHELQRDLRAEGLDYAFADQVEAADEVRQLAVLSKIAPKAVVRHGTLTFPFNGRDERVKRGALEIVFGTPSGDVTLWVVHLKSRFTEEPGDPAAAQRRAGEAVAVRDLVLSRYAEPEAARFAILGDCNDTKTSRPLRALQERGELRFTELLPALDSRGESWTHHFAKADSYDRVDYVLVSPALKPLVRGGAARIVDLPEVRQASDHRPVVFVLELP